jgi:hypothetical protein
LKGDNQTLTERNIGSVQLNTVERAIISISSMHAGDVMGKGTIYPCIKTTF